ncbi:MAG: ATP-binding protein [Patescibacteria group bacterium]|jgi:predicted kinase|nr:ATP-binding protein [Patescibacteria group bacterium]
MTKLTPNKPFLVVYYGYPGSGRTYFSRQFAEEVQVAHLQSDRIRSELFEKPRYDKQENVIVRQLINYMTEEFLGAGLSVIYDADILTNAQRTMLKNIALKYSAEFVVIWLQIDEETSFGRIARRDKRKQDDKYAPKWDRTTFDAIIKQMQNPTVLKDTIVISGKHLYHTQRNAVLSGLSNRGIINLADNLMVPKPGMVNLIPKAQGRVDLNRRNVFIR